MTRLGAFCAALAASTLSGCQAGAPVPEQPEPEPTETVVTVEFQPSERMERARLVRGMSKAESEWQGLSPEARALGCEMRTTDEAGLLETVTPRLAYDLSDQEFLVWLDGACERTPE